MSSNEIRQKFLEFFKSKGHSVIPSASLIPDDSTVLFVTAGMQPLVPYLTGKVHPLGTRLVDAQKCLRTDDILEVGDNRHLTFFEMLGNWSLGDYFKKESIEWSFELLTSPQWFGISPTKLFVTVFDDSEMNIPRDDESIGHWTRVFREVGIEASLANGRIATYPKKKNWWELPGTGPCGPDTEIFYDTGKEHDQAFGEVCHPNCDCGRFVEIWNNVFMEYEKKIDGQGGFEYLPLAQKNVDTGMGLERMAMVLQNKETVFEIDIFFVVIKTLENPEFLYKDQAHRYRIIADHLRASLFLISDGVLPSNTDRGYILRSLIRRAITHAKILQLSDEFYNLPVELLQVYYASYYRLLPVEDILLIINQEYALFSKAFETGKREFDHLAQQSLKKDLTLISGTEAFNLHQSFGFRLELISDLAKDVGLKVDEVGFWEAYKTHQSISRAGSEKKFGGHGLMLQTGELKAGTEQELKKVTQLHTATHLLQAALRQVLGHHVHQRGSDITAERLRFDFSHPQKMTNEEKEKVEKLVNEEIAKGLSVSFKEMSIDEAEKTGALMFQKEKYGKTVKVYSVGDFSQELCGGPHVVNTNEM
ncbi:alanine--tRNA ligase, partial [Candidatus Azambacteria bacterium]|nr:alanine--tRNA ligase [Candidatus Azambacteria bacterium]